MNNSLLNGNYTKKLILKEIICFSEMNGQKHNIHKSLGHNEGNLKRQTYNTMNLHKKFEKSHNLITHLKL